ncbi:MAG: pyridoxine 5'-phosphate synthase [Mangrovibacterium sp.]
MTRLSVNINKIATLRNSRGGVIPSVVDAAINCQQFGAHGITVHPRPDERHITKQDVYDIKPHINTEFNIEGYPDERFINLVIDIKADQATLVPDKPGQLTSDHGWDTITHHDTLKSIVNKLKTHGIRTSIFVDPDVKMIEGAHKVGCDRIELYTESYAALYKQDPSAAIDPFIKAAERAKELGMGINAGHDLNIQNLKYFVSKIPYIDEVSIGHALIADALYMGLHNTVKEYLYCLED